MSRGRSRFDLYCLSDDDEYLGDTAAEYSVQLPGVTGRPTLAALEAAIDRADTGRSVASNPFCSTLGDALFAKPPPDPSSPKGRLRLSGRAIFFEPDSLQLPILSWRFTEAFTIVRLESCSNKGLLLVFRAPAVSLMSIRAKHHMHIVDSSASAILEHVFLLTSSATAKGFTGRLHAMIGAGQNSNDGEALRTSAVDAIHEAVQRNTPFSYSWLTSPLEELVAQFPCVRISPLRHHRGRVVITTRCLYFQPCFPLDSAVPFEVYPVEHMRRAASRRIDFEDRGIEIALQLPRHEVNRGTSAVSNSTSVSAGSGGSSRGGGSSGDASYLVLLFAFNTTETRDLCTDAIRKTANRLQPPPRSLLSNFDDTLPTRIGKMCAAWCDGRVSTFDYLMFLNWAAGRTLADLAQYPVLPWVIADYTSPVLNLDDPHSFRDLSKPIGALNPTRLKRFLERADELRAMKEEPYLYGSHYSNAAYVSFWLLRERPEFMLALHSGRFDNPARIFDSIPATWNSVTNGPTDVKELVPQFFLGTGMFLSAEGSSIEFRDVGVKSDGKKPRDVVELPPWATTQEEFVRKNREALEGPYVSMNLNHWIDLIFGFKQQGEAAWRAHNVFHPHCYARTSRDALPTGDQLERAALLAHIREFGQVPKQLFSDPHPQRRVTSTPQHLIRLDTFLDVSEESLNVTLSENVELASPMPQHGTRDSKEPNTELPVVVDHRGTDTVDEPPVTAEASSAGHSLWRTTTELSLAWAKTRICSTSIRCFTHISGREGEPPTVVAIDGHGGIVLWSVSPFQTPGYPLSVTREGATPLIAVHSFASTTPSATVVSRGGLVAVMPIAPGLAVNGGSARPPVPLMFALDITKSIVTCAAAYESGCHGGFLVGCRDGTLQVVPLENGAPLMAARKISASSEGAGSLQWDLESAIVALSLSPSASVLYALNEDGALFAIGSPSEGVHWRLIAGVGVPPVTGSTTIESVQLQLSEQPVTSSDVLGLVGYDDGTVTVLTKSGVAAVVVMCDDTTPSGTVLRLIALTVPLGATSLSCVASAIRSAGVVLVGTSNGVIALLDPRSFKVLVKIRVSTDDVAITHAVIMEASTFLVVSDAAGHVYCLKPVSQA